MKVIAADYHRNGIAGAGFFVGIVQDASADTAERRMLIIQFEEDPALTAVIDLDEAAQGNIYMFPRVFRDESGQLQRDAQTGNNAWRGADGGFDAAVAAVREHVDKDRDLESEYYHAQLAKKDAEEKK